MEHSLSVALERVRYKLLRAYRSLANEGAISPEQFREVARLLERIEHVPLDEVRRVLAGLSASPTQGGGAVADREEAA